MKKSTHTNPGFTLIELMIVVSIMTILTVMGALASSRLIKNFRFTNIFNKMVFMTQSSRNMAATGKDKEKVVNYGIEIKTDKSPQTIKQFSNPVNAPNTQTFLDTQTVEATTNLKVAVNTTAQKCPPSPAECLNGGAIKFTNGSTQTELLCNGTPATFLLVTLFESDCSLIKTFSIQSVGGIPQVQ